MAIGDMWPWVAALYYPLFSTKNIGYIYIYHPYTSEMYIVQSLRYRMENVTITGQPACPSPTLLASQTTLWF